MLSMFMLERSGPDHDLILPLALRRVAAFCPENDSDSDPEMLVGNLVRDFVSTEPKLFALFVAVKDGALVGHLLACRDRYFHLQVVTVLQYQLDEGIDPELLKPVFEQLAEWGNLHQATRIRARVKTDSQARRLKMFYGFTRDAIVMERAI